MTRSVIALACLALLAGPALAQKADEPGEEVRLSLDRYARLMRLADARAGARVTWSRGSLSARVEGETMRVTVSARVRAVGGGPVCCPPRPCSPTPAWAGTAPPCCACPARMWP